MYEHNEWMQGRREPTQLCSALYEFEVLWMDLNGVSLLTTNSFRSSDPQWHTLEIVGKNLQFQSLAQDLIKSRI